MLHPTAGTPARPRRMVVFKREMPLYLMLIPGVAFAFVFFYLPMFGLVMAFQNYSPLRSFSGSEWVGLKNFQAMLSLPTFWTVVRNTLMISSVRIRLTYLASRPFFFVSPGGCSKKRTVSSFSTPAFFSIGCFLISQRKKRTRTTISTAAPTAIRIVGPIWFPEDSITGGAAP